MRGNPQTLCSASRYDNGTAHLMTAHLVTSCYIMLHHYIDVFAIGTTQVGVNVKLVSARLFLGCQIL